MSAILIVDDEPSVTKSLGNVISRLGLNTLVTDNGNEALDLIKKDKPQAVFLDINIQGLKGIEVLKEAQKIAPQTKIVVITGDVNEEVENEAEKLGAFAFLRKPFTIQDIQKIIASIGLIKS